LICLNTSTREIPIQGLRFRDWEEIPIDNLDMQKEWNRLIASMLGSDCLTTAEDYPLFNGAWLVETSEGKVALRDVILGCNIRDIDGKWTRVIGIYEGKEAVEVDSGTFWHTDSIWWNENGKWIQKKMNKAKLVKQRGFHLVTGSGTFKISTGSTEYAVRDFTEVGQMRIGETYEWMKQRL